MNWNDFNPPVCPLVAAGGTSILETSESCIYWIIFRFSQAQHVVLLHLIILLLSLRDLVQEFGSAWTCLWFRWAGMTLKPFASGKERDCLRKTSGSGLHVVVYKVCSKNAKWHLLDLCLTSFWSVCYDHISLFGVPGRIYPWGNKFQANRSNLWQVRQLQKIHRYTWL